MSASVLLVNPKYPHNVGGAYRAAACFGAEGVMVTGHRVRLQPTDSYRLPREERLRVYRDEVQLRHVTPYSDLIERDLTPVAVEVSSTAEQLHHFVHPENALYMFGPEDGSLPRFYREMAHRFVVIPSYHCLNLAGAVYVTLYDRIAKARLAGSEPEVPSAELMGGEGRGWAEHPSSI